MEMKVKEFLKMKNMSNLEKKQNDAIILYNLYLTLFTNKNLTLKDVNYIYNLNSKELDLFIEEIQKKLKGGGEDEK